MKCPHPSPGRFGRVAVIGRPNVGKSTLLNRLLGQKISITSRKPQTTRQQILGIKTLGNTQAVYVDTPGLINTPKRALNRYMNRQAKAVLGDVDVVLFVIEAQSWTDLDKHVLAILRSVSVPIILTVNKVDKVKDKTQLLPFLGKVAELREFQAIMPISALSGDNVDELEQLIFERLPAGKPYFPEDYVTDRSVRFLAAEIIREKLLSRLGDEIPHRLVVKIDEFGEQALVTHISATIWVETTGQKKIVVGKGGQVLKNAGTSARKELEEMLGGRVFLQTWVKVKEKWSDDLRALQHLGLC